MTKVNFVFILLLSVFLVSCGQNGSNGKKTIALSKRKLEAVLAKQEFECASIDGSPCPSGIARLFIFNAKDPKNSALCSGFLSGTDKIVTNHHCLSTDFECKNTFVSIYNGDSYENVKCDSIIETKADPGALSQKGVDFTVFKIDRSVNIKTFAVSKFNAYVGDTLTAWVIDHVSLTHGRITELNCNYSEKLNSMLLKHCPAIHGNSGSPVLNSYKEIVGVLWGSTVDEEVDEKMDLYERRNLQDYALVTELRHFKDYLSGK